jgi:RHS repeat-associated protein
MTHSAACSFSVASRDGYKFTGKERDSESGLDNFGARYHASSLGRFMTPDWAAKRTTVPYASFGNPQSLTSKQPDNDPRPGRTLCGGLPRCRGRRCSALRRRGCFTRRDGGDLEHAFGTAISEYVHISGVAIDLEFDQRDR